MKYIYLLVSAISIYSCITNGNYDTELSEIENLVNSAADSALIRIADIDKTRLKSEREKARYSLLYSIILDKNYIDVTSDTLIRYAVDYYSREGNAEEKAKTYFYYGRVAHNQEDYNTALENYLLSEQYCLDTGNLDLLALINNHIGMLYHFLRETDKAEEKLRRAASIYHQIQKKYHEASSRLQLSKILIFNSDYNEAIIECERALEIFSDLNDESQMASAILHIANIYFYELANPQIALEYFESSTRDLNVPIYLSAYPLLSKIHFALGNMEEASRYCEEFYRNQNETLRNGLFYHSQMRNIEEAKGNFAQALKFQDEYDNLWEQLINETQGDKIREIEEKFQNELLSVTNRSLKKKNRLIGIISVIIPLFLSTLFLYIIRLRNEAIKKRNLKIDEYYLLTEKLQSTNKELEKIREGLSEKLDEKSLHESELKTSIEKRVMNLKELLEMVSLYEHKPEKFLDKFKVNIHKHHKDSFFKDLHLVVDNKYGGVITYLKSHFPRLTKGDLDFICLNCLGFDNNEISLIYGHSNLDSIYTKSHRIRKKMNLERTKNLKTFFTELKSQHEIAGKDL